MGKNRYNFSLSRKQIVALLAVLLCAAGVLTVVLPGQIWYSDQPGLQADRIVAATERVDPNTASAASLQRLPSLGPSRAQAIIRYRQEQESKGSRAFAKPDDLAKVPGFGKGTVNKIKPYLKFESPPTSE